MSESKNNKQYGIAFCRTSKTYGAAKHHLNLQERHIQQTADIQGVTLRRAIKVQGKSVGLETLIELADGANIIYVVSADRLTRSMVNLNKLTDALKSHDIELRVTNGNVDSIFENLRDYLIGEQYYWAGIERSRKANQEE